MQVRLRGLGTRRAKMPNKAKKPVSWWGEYSLDLDQPMTWEIGTQRLQVIRLDNEWQVVYETLGQETDGWTHDARAKPLGESFPRHRVVFRETHPNLYIAPRLADRSVVSRPAVPFTVPPGEEVTLFVSSPLWAQLKVHDSKVSLHEVPLQRPSDTWFGPTTAGDGEFCYASRTQGRLSLDEVPRRMHRAITPVVVSNHASSEFLLERVNLPVTYLSLYQGARGYLWTQSVTMHREEDAARASIEIGDGAPDPAQPATLVEEPRVAPEGRTLLRAVSALFG